MSLVLLRPGLDVWEPGEHNGTFRGNNPAFVTATAALATYWAGDDTRRGTLARGAQTEAALRVIAAEHAGAGAAFRGRGLVWGLTFADPARATAVCRRAFRLGLLLETSGPRGEVVKLLPPLTITAEELDWGLRLLARAVQETEPPAAAG
jgi:diaminobutyrate-2-oxoglutarate transaminase